MEFDTSAPTIGRWQLSDRESRTGITVNDAAGRRVARVPLRTDDLDIARLIAAAPDLLAALERWEENRFHIIEALKRIEGTEALRAQLHHELDDAKAALARARGE